LILIIDTNSVIAALLKDSASRKIILSGKFKFFSLKILHEEIDRYQDEIIQRTNMTPSQFFCLKERIASCIAIVADEKVVSFMEEARHVMDMIDSKDTPFIALALAVENDGVWSEDRRFEQQSRVKVWKTKELLRWLEGTSLED